MLAAYHLCDILFQCISDVQKQQARQISTTDWKISELKQTFREWNELCCFHHASCMAKGNLFIHVHGIQPIWTLCTLFVHELSYLLAQTRHAQASLVATCRLSCHAHIDAQRNPSSCIAVLVHTHCHHAASETPHQGSGFLTWTQQRSS